MGYTTTELLAKVNMWSAAPDGQPAFTDANLLDLMTDELHANIVPFITSFREDFFVESIDYTIASETSGYAIPTRAVSTVLKDVKYVIDTDREINVPRVPVGDKEFYTNGFYIQGNKIMLLNPENRSGETLRMYYYSRPNTLVTVAECAKVTVVGSTSLTVASIPATWSSGATLDLTQGASPLGLISKDNVTTWTGVSDITPTTMPDDIAVGDYLSLATESCIPQIPVEMIPMLTQAVVMRVNEILSDKDGLKVATTKYDSMVKSITGMLSPRVTEEAKTIVSKGSFLNMRTNNFRTY